MPHTRPAQASLALRPAGSLDRQKRPLSRGFGPSGSRRVYIPKADGRQRPLAVAALEDKIVQRATIGTLNAIYEEDFLGFSYGFRPEHGQHDALDALVVGIATKKVNFILDADIRSNLFCRIVVQRKRRCHAKTMRSSQGSRSRSQF